MSAGSVAEGEGGDPPGFPCVAAQLRFNIRNGMVLHLDDFYLRRLPLYMARADHGLPWAEMLAKVWAEELGRDTQAAEQEVARLRVEIERRNEWCKRASPPLEKGD